MTGGVLRRFLRVHHLRRMFQISTQGTAGFRARVSDLSVRRLPGRVEGQAWPHRIQSMRIKCQIPPHKAAV